MCSLSRVNCSSFLYIERVPHKGWCCLRMLLVKASWGLICWGVATACTVILLRLIPWFGLLLFLLHWYLRTMIILHIFLYYLSLIEFFSCFFCSFNLWMYIWNFINTKKMFMKLTKKKTEKLCGKKVKWTKMTQTCLPCAHPYSLTQNCLSWRLNVLISS